jgi:hypothetical protein
MNIKNAGTSNLGPMRPKGLEPVPGAPAGTTSPTPMKPGQAGTYAPLRPGTAPSVKK